jgi:hypothetical protein
MVKRAIMDDFYPLPNIEMILQQFAWSQMMTLLDIFPDYNQIKVNEADNYKTTFITDLGTLTYECKPFGLYDVGTTFKKLVQITLEELINIHIYLDDLIIYVKGLLITSEFQLLFLGPLKNLFVLDTKSYI